MSLEVNSVDTNLFEQIALEKQYEKLEKLLKSFDQSTLIEIMTQTTNDEVRNKAALILSDSPTLAGGDAIAALIENPQTYNNRGTLLYALGKFDYSAYVSILISCVLNGNYEVQREAFSLLQNRKFDISKQDKCNNHKKVQDAVEEEYGYLGVLLDVLAMCSE